MLRNIRLCVAAFFLAGALVSGSSPAEASSTVGQKKNAASVAPNKKAAVSKKAVAAKAKSARRKRVNRPDTAAAQTVQQNREGKYAALVVDASTGKILYDKNASGIRYPASLTKMMTLYLTFDALKKGRISLGQSMPVSAKAARQPATNINLKAGERLPVEAAIESIIVRSANDSAMVMAEALGKTEWNFALMMTQKARQLGMKNTVFRNPNGLPDNKQHTTAYDMARLAIALRRDFPEYYHYFKRQSFDYKGVSYESHNRVIARYPGADGVKTGFIRASGFNLVTSVKKDGYNIVAVVMGGDSAARRDDQMVDLLNRTFAELENRRRVAVRQSSGKEPQGVAVPAATPSSQARQVVQAGGA